MRMLIRKSPKSMTKVSISRSLFSQASKSCFSSVLTSMGKFTDRLFNNDAITSKVITAYQELA